MTFTSTADVTVSVGVGTAGGAEVGSMGTSLAVKAGSVKTHTWPNLSGLSKSEKYLVSLGATCKASAKSVPITISEYTKTPFTINDHTPWVTCGSYDVSWTVPSDGPASGPVTVTLVSGGGATAATIASETTASSKKFTVPAGMAAGDYTVQVKSSNAGVSTGCAPAASAKVTIGRSASDDLAITSPPAGTTLNGCLSKHKVTWKKPAGLALTAVYLCKTTSDCSSDAGNRVVTVASSTGDTTGAFALPDGPWWWLRGARRRGGRLRRSSGRMTIIT